MKNLRLVFALFASFLLFTSCADILNSSGPVQIQLPEITISESGYASCIVVVSSLDKNDRPISTPLNDLFDAGWGIAPMEEKNLSYWPTQSSSDKFTEILNVISKTSGTICANGVKNIQGHSVVTVSLDRVNSGTKFIVGVFILDHNFTDAHDPQNFAWRHRVIYRAKSDVYIIQKDVTESIDLILEHNDAY
ncbi:MAG: hypothetical protein IJR49_06200 [Treponema sp.]|nr:hypothetical protein [Treponema sp.]